jgi:hypothetical protein
MITSHFPKPEMMTDVLAKPCGETFLGQGLFTGISKRLDSGNK